MLWEHSGVSKFGGKKQAWLLIMTLLGVMATVTICNKGGAGNGKGAKTGEHHHARYYLDTRADTRACTADTDAAQRPHNRTGESKIVHAGQILQRHQQQNELALSWIYASSNDDYGGRPAARLAASLQALLWGLHQYSLDKVSEVIVVDWVSSKEMQPLFDTPELTKVWQHYTKFGSRTRIRILTIYQEDASAFVVDPLQRLSEVHALNAAAQRARGSFLLRLDQDTLVGTSFFRFLANEKEAAWPHHHQPWFAGRRECDPQQSDEVIRDPVKFVSDAGDNVVSGDGSSHENLMGGPVGVVGLPAWLWRLVQGYNERYVKWGHMEHELFLRLTTLTDVLPLSKYTDVSTPFYHIHHHKATAADGDRQSNEFHDFGQNAAQARAAFNNSLAWGLAEMQIPERVVLPLTWKQKIRLQTALLQRGVGW